MEEKSKETLLWEELLNDIISWKNRKDLVDSGKMIARPLTQSQFIKQLKHKYYLDNMKHNNKNYIEIDLSRVPKDFNPKAFLDELRRLHVHIDQSTVDSYINSKPWNKLK